MDIGIIGGTGKQGFGLAKRLVKLGYVVRIGSRQEEKGKDKANELSGSVTGGTNLYASQADIVILTIPAEQIESLIGPLKSELTNKVVIDNINNLKFGKIVKIEPFQGRSVYEFLLNFLPDSTVVTALKTVSSVLLDSDEELDQSDFIISPTDEGYEVVSQISEKLGLFPVRVISAYHSETIERMVALSVQINKQYKKKHSGFLVKM